MRNSRGGRVDIGGQAGMAAIGWQFGQVICQPTATRPLRELRLRKKLWLMGIRPTDVNDIIL